MNTAISYPNIDIAALNNAADGVAAAGIETDRLYTQTEYLPSLSSKVLASEVALRTAHYQMKKLTDDVASRINIDIGVLERYLLAAKRATPSIALTNRISGQITKVSTAVQNVSLELERLYKPLTEKIDRATTGRYLTQLNAEKIRLPAKIQETLQRKDDLERKRQALTDSLTLLESKGIAQIGKDTILDAQKLSQLSVAGPEAAVIQQGIELAQQILENLENLISYIGLANARDVIRGQINELLAQAEGEKGELHLVNLRYELISTVHDFDDHKTAYTAEFFKIVMATQSFITEYRTIDANDESSVLQFVDDAVGLAQYVDAIA